MHKFIVIGILLAPILARSEVMRIVEAEDAKVTCAAGKDPAETIWASGAKVTPAFWGRAKGDTLECTIDVTAPVKDIGLALRYSYASAHYRQTQGTEAEKRVLQLTIDNGPPIEVAVPNTDWWDIFQTTNIPLPTITQGRHTLRLTSPAEHACTNVDCLILYRGKFEIIPAALRSTTIATSESKRFVIRTTPKAPMKLPATTIFKDFDRIFAHYEDYIGWAPPTPMAINLIEDSKWPNPGATSFQNNGGVFFRAGVMNSEQGNWVHEMIHMFYVAHFPWWFDESSVRTLTMFDFAPALFDKFKADDTNKGWRDCVAAGKDLLAHPEKRVDDIDIVHYAIRVKYGPDVFKKFFHACVEAGKKKQLDFEPGHHLKRDDIVKYMSAAAGEDVGPIYRQWNGFDKAE